MHPHAHMCTHTYAHAYRYIHTNTGAHICIHMHICPHTYICTCSHTDTYIHKHRWTYMHLHSLMQKHTYMHTHKDTYSHKHRCTYMYPHAHMHRHTLPHPGICVSLLRLFSYSPNLFFYWLDICLTLEWGRMQPRAGCHPSSPSDAPLTWISVIEHDSQGIIIMNNQTIKTGSCASHMSHTLRIFSFFYKPWINVYEELRAGFVCSGRMQSLELDVPSLGTSLTPPESEYGC